jgi:hypothetical protein
LPEIFVLKKPIKKVFPLRPILVQAACDTHSPTELPFSTAIETPVPTSTITSTATLPPLPAFMDEFVALGYDQQSFESDRIYVILNGKYTYTHQRGGLLYKRINGVCIFSWVKVYSIRNGYSQE